MSDQNFNGDNGHYAAQDVPDADYDNGGQDEYGSPGGDSAPDQQDRMDYDEMDLTPYEDDDDTTLHKKLCAAKAARKRAEEDLKLLCNRIGLLKMEEGKVVKKIDETRKRAT